MTAVRGVAVTALGCAVLLGLGPAAGELLAPALPGSAHQVTVVLQAVGLVLIAWRGSRYVADRA